MRLPAVTKNAWTSQQPNELPFGAITLDPPGDAALFLVPLSRTVFEAAGGSDTFELAWKIARPNAVVVVVAMYEEDQTLPLPQMYGKNLIFKTGGVDGCRCQEIMDLIEAGRLDASFLISHRMFLDDIVRAYDLFEEKADHVMKIAIKP